MKVINKRESGWLFWGDLLIFTFSLWLTLAVRFHTWPTAGDYWEHLWPFGLLFLIWSLIFFIAGLYEKHTVSFKRHLLARIINAQILNSLLAVVFFYFIPYFGITPKVILFIYIIIFSLLILLWRLYGQKLFGLKTREKGLVLGRGEELIQLVKEVNANPRYGLEIVSSFDLDNFGAVDFQADILDQIKSRNISVVILDLHNETLKKNQAYFYNLLFSRIRFIDIDDLYEDIFDRVPLSLINYDWFLKNISLTTDMTYDFFKRTVDCLFACGLGLISLVLYPFIFLAIKLDDQGPIFISQERLGKNNRLIRIIKFRTMSFNDNERTDPAAAGGKVNKITRVGAFLRQSRLDEIPQLWNVWTGDLSLIGPRPELPALARVYEQAVPYYNVRHLITPGLSGWAQLYHENHPHHGVNTVETKNKLSYDLYYVKNRSWLLDLKIILKTVKTLLSRSGR